MCHLSQASYDTTLDAACFVSLEWLRRALGLRVGMSVAPMAMQISTWLAVGAVLPVGPSMPRGLARRVENVPLPFESFPCRRLDLSVNVEG
jgi:hypothetical protein